MNPFRQHSELWRSVRDLQEAVRQLNDRLETIEALRKRRSAQRDWILTKLLPTVAALIIAFGTLDTIFRWTM